MPKPGIVRSVSSSQREVRIRLSDSSNRDAVPITPGIKRIGNVRIELASFWTACDKLRMHLSSQHKESYCIAIIHRQGNTWNALCFSMFCGKIHESSLPYFTKLLLEIFKYRLGASLNPH